MSGYVVIYEAVEDGSVSAYVRDLPTILVLGGTRREAWEAVLKGIQIYREEMELMGAPMPELSAYHEVASV